MINAPRAREVFRTDAGYGTVPLTAVEVVTAPAPPNGRTMLTPYRLIPEAMQQNGPTVALPQASNVTMNG